MHCALVRSEIQKSARPHLESYVLSPVIIGLIGLLYRVLPVARVPTLRTARPRCIHRRERNFYALLHNTTNHYSVYAVWRRSTSSLPTPGRSNNHHLSQLEVTEITRPVKNRPVPRGWASIAASSQKHYSWPRSVFKNLSYNQL